VRRESLALLLWPDYTPQRAAANLRRTIWAAHQALGVGRIAATPAEVELLRGADLWIDLDRFRQLLEDCRAHGHRENQVCPDCLSPLGEAIALVRGSFLEGFSLADSAEFDDWQALQATGVRQLYAQALWRLADGWIAQGDLPQALDLARRLTDLDPLHEPAQRRLMLLYAWTAQHVEALRCYRELERLLAHELSASPEQETTDLFMAIRARQEPPPPKLAVAPTSPSLGAFSKHLTPGSAQLPPAGSPGAPSRSPASPVGSLFTSTALVAREQELARLDAQMRAVLDGQTRAIFVVGDAGSGKTALLEGFARRAHATHPQLVAAIGNCNAYVGVGDPYLPFRQILELLAGDPSAGSQPSDLQGGRADLFRHLLLITARALVTVGQDLLGTLLPAHTLLARAAEVAEHNEPWFQQLRRLAAGGKRPVDPTLQQSSLFEQYARVLRAVAQEQPLLLVLDDLQWADLGSINLLLHLGRRLQGQPVLIVGAYRWAEVALGRQGERHPLEPVVHELQRIYGEPAIDLGATHGRRFVDDLLDQQPNLLGEDFRASLYRQTGGHALFTIELLRGVHERGDLIRDATGRLIARPTLDLNRLPARVDAVIAERVDRLEASDRELLRLASVQGEEFSAEVVAHILGLDEPEVQRRLSDRLDRQHVFVRSSGTSLVGGLQLCRYRFRHFLIQRYLYYSLDAAERAYWNERMCEALETLHGEQTEVAAVQLARHAQEAGRIDLAIRFLQQAGDYTLRLSANAEATEHYQHALALLERLPDTGARQVQELSLQIALSKPLQLIMGYSAAEVARAFERAMSLGRALGSPPELVQLLGRYAHFLITRGEHHKAQAVAEELLSLARQFEDEALLLEAVTAQGIVAFYLGERAAALYWLDQATGLYDRDRHRSLTYAYGIEPGVHIGIYTMLTRWFLDQPEQARAQQEATLVAARTSRHPHTLAFALAFASLLDSLDQDVPATLRRTEEAIDLCEEHGFVLMRGLAQALRGWAISAAGEPEEGLALFHVAEEAAEQMQVLAIMPYLESLLAEIEQRCGRLGEALLTIDRALALADQTKEGAFLAAMHRIKARLQRAIGHDIC
jgi:predicted ATPase/DNA-binding SARP family transcriptional activator